MYYTEGWSVASASGSACPNTFNISPYQLKKPIIWPKRLDIQGLGKFSMLSFQGLHDQGTMARCWPWYHSSWTRSQAPLFSCLPYVGLLVPRLFGTDLGVRGLRPVLRTSLGSLEPCGAKIADVSLLFILFIF